VSEDHGPDEPYPGRYPNSQERGNPSQKIRSEEDAAQNSGVKAELQMEPVDHDALHDEPTGKSIEREE
jgi:hypothetical protein